MKPLISLCMIVKNEEEVLRRCLDSISGIIENIIIVDTGSTDCTKEIAGEYTKEVYNFEWTNDFSKARNFAASKAKGKWILSLDADEYVDRKNLIETIERIKNGSDNTDLYNVSIVHFIGENAEETMKSTFPRFYRNISQIKYYRAIHETLRVEREFYP